jgi:penicillin-binding protein 2
VKSTTARLSLLGAVFGVACFAVLLHLWFVMVEQHEAWERLSYRNRWTFRDVPTHRGAITDRFGQLLVHDVPTFRLGIDYEQFRRSHPLGTAVHGANLLAAHDERLQGVEFTYGREPAGAASACGELLALPVQRLRPGGPDREFVRDLRFYVVYLLAGLSQRGAAWTNRAITDALGKKAMVAVGDCLPGFSREQLQATFVRALAEVAALDLALPEGHGRGQLLDKLDGLRADWLAGAARPQRLQPVADRLSFDVAAGLRTSKITHPGLRLEPSVRRERTPVRDGDSVVDALLGAVHTFENWENEGEVQRRVRDVLPEEGLEELVPEGAGPEPVREDLQRSAASYVDLLVRSHGRLGTGGIEAAADATLAGSPGLRLIERDKKAKEQQMLSLLRVDPGQDVALTIDLDLQRVVETVSEATYRDWSTRVDSVGLGLLDVGAVLIDAGTGEILAVAGAPLRRDGALRPLPPGLNWYRIGDIGSLAKPFVQLEQFDAEREGRPCGDEAGFRPCVTHYGQAGGTKLECDGRHGDLALDPVQALAHSCNFWFFHVAEGLGLNGVHRAYRRFGLMAPVAADGFPADTWQPRPFGCSNGAVSTPKVHGLHPLQLRGIGYGVEASPAMVARAYAALATGTLRGLTLVRGESTAAVPLGIPDGDRARVLEGLRLCVESGTASRADNADLLWRLQVYGKTGTAEILKPRGDNNALFAGFLPYRGLDGVQLAFCAAVYCVPNGEHGGRVAGEFMAKILMAMQEVPLLQRRYLTAEAGR